MALADILKSPTQEDAMYQHEITAELIEACERELQQQKEYESDRLRDGMDTTSSTRRHQLQAAITERMSAGQSLDEIVADNQKSGLTKSKIYRFCESDQDIMKAN